ncbi:methionyl-tRNA formyltransferase [Brachybacterium hainanense]|uniref:Methionyl-tRNA formyltransferase n=1 Tax=Brachybacterium hainanense TaxID=1541174 RepID=A0ABV6RBB6_9MICO
MRVLFAGTPAAAVPSLRALLESDHEVVAVLTRPDAPTGRGRRLRPSPVRALADEAGVPVLTPPTLRDAAVQEQLRRLAPEAAPVVAYGNLIPAPALDIPRHGWINLHFSLLPAWRGAAPVQRAVLAGQTRTGMTTFRIDAGMDTGDVLASRPVDIGPLETSGELLERLAHDGAPLLVETLDALADGTARAVPQRGEASHAAKLTAQEARIDWSADAAVLDAHIRGMSPDPGAWTLLRGERFKILGVDATQPPADLVLAPGELHATRRALFVGTGTAPIAIGTVAPAGKKAMRAADWARGAALEERTLFAPPTDAEEAR